MRKPVVVLSFGTLAMLAIACHDVVQPPLPHARSVSGASPAALLTLISPVQRSSALDSDITWSFTAGPGGAVSTNPATGLTVRIPTGALADTVTITVTALAGTPVAYRFEPHGLLFARTVSLTQDLRLTTANILSSLALSGAYFASDTLQLTSDGLALVTEVIGAATNPLTQTATFPIAHFSGYILASGRDSTSTDGGQ